MPEPLPVTIIGGYLGAGKTTLVNHLLRTANGRKLAILVNEFGALPIDEDLIEAQGDDLISIAGGCICCSFGSDLSAALMDMADLPERPDQVVIECSGVAIPSAIAASVSLLDGFTPDGTVVIVDAETIREAAVDDYIGDTITRQLVDADLVIMNKADLVRETTSLEQWLTDTAPRAKTLRAVQGKAPLDMVLGLGATPLHSHQSGHADGLFDSVVLPCTEPLDGEVLAQTLTKDALHITRAKGFYEDSSNGKRKTLHIVGRRWVISEAPENAPLGIVCIGLKGQFDSNHILSTLRASVTFSPPKKDKRMSDTPEYTPPKVWTWDQESGGKFASINRPIAGPTHDKELPRGEHPLQLHSLGTPNGVKVTIMLEELLAAGHAGAEYDAWIINIGEGDQFSSGFVEVNPNSKIPAMMDYSGDKPVRLFESASIMMHLAEKFGAFIPEHARAECFNWLFWQMGSAPYLGGGFGHFYAYAPFKMEYPINRFAMEVKRQMDVLDRHLSENEYFAGGEYSIADMAIWPWYGRLALGGAYEAGEFLDVKSYKHLQRWTAQIGEREAVKRGKIVNTAWGPENEQLANRHSAADIDAVMEK